ncbi:hypothetical protein L596_010979 [Steinernema carpocapsae]|uniref:SCP domain-containing protein n=1 Tax=Steinernema carpocapsae TaxID=34508 RepID=A0A4V6A4D0_STECR|nr:hypothetical protein L596_010979 [Steinernema carpocapsae]
MHWSTSLLLASVLVFGISAHLPDNHTFRKTSGVTYSTSTARNDTTEVPDASVCTDRKLGAIIDTALSYYSHNMDQLTKYILDQIVRAHYSGNYLVHAQMINAYHQGVQWQSTTNGDLFTGRSRTGCYYHDTETFILLVKY